MRVMLIDGRFIAEGTPSECAEWAYMMIMVERDVQEKKAKEEAAKELERVKLFKDMTFEELMKREDETGE